MHPHALDERHELCQTLRRTPPDSATLCGDWTAAQLTAHMVQRERSLTEALGRLPVDGFRARAEARLADIVAADPYTELVDSLDAGPPRFSPWALPVMREAVNLLEYAIHHEDVRRVGPEYSPRPISVARQRAIWQRLHLSAPLTMRNVPVGVTLIWPGHSQLSTRRAKRGGASVIVSGDPLELALVTFGRQRVARVDYGGAPADVRAVSGAQIAI